MLEVGDEMQFDQVPRREFMALLGSAAPWPRAAQLALPVIG